MFPTFGEIFGQPIPAYFILLILGFSLATWVCARWAKQARLDHDVMIDLGLFSLIAGVAGARILHVLADGFFMDYVHLCTAPDLVLWHVEQSECTAIEGVWHVATASAPAYCGPSFHEAWTLDGCFAWAAFWRGGLTYYGGLIAAAAYGLWFLHKEKFPMLKGADVASLGIALGLFFGRMGCFLGGCCFGLPTEGPFGVSFPAWSPASEAQHKAGLLATAGMASLPVHPTQLYEAAGNLTITALLMFVIHPRKRFDGQVFCSFLALYSFLRFGVEYLRADDRGALLGLSTSQLISLGATLAAIVLWTLLSRRKTSTVG